MIEEYRFGYIRIDGKVYHYDVEVRWTGEVLEWRREQSHVIDVPDIQAAVAQNPQVIVIGAGEAGRARVTEGAAREIKSKGIELIVDPTEEATKTFNIIKEDSLEEEGAQKRVIGLFHLTC